MLTFIPMASLVVLLSLRTVIPLSLLRFLIIRIGILGIIRIGILYQGCHEGSPVVAVALEPSQLLLQ